MAHLSETGSYEGILSRNGDNGRKGARQRMKGTGIYDNEANIEMGVRRQRSVNASTSRDEIQKKTRKYKFNYRNRIGGVSFMNFIRGARPYFNASHHILPCEMFYDWDSDHLDVLLQCKYDINRKQNIIYLPVDYSKSDGKGDSCYYHNLPNHGYGHTGNVSYNSRIAGEVEKVHNLVDEAIKKGKCEETKDIRAKIVNKLQEIESYNFDLLRALGPGPLR